MNDRDWNETGTQKKIGLVGEGDACMSLHVTDESRFLEKERTGTDVGKRDRG